MYLKLSVAGHLTIFLTRTRGPFWSIRPARVLWVAVVGTQIVATLIAVYGLFMTPLGWGWAGFVWGYALAWALLNDRVKLLAYRIFDPVKAEAKPDAKIVSKPETKAEPKPEARAEIDPGAKAGAGVKPAVKPKPEAKEVEPKPEIKVESKPEGKAKTTSNLAPQIAARAYELYEQQGRREGQSVQNWDKAEREIRKDQAMAEPTPETKTEPKTQAKTEPEAKPTVEAQPVLKVEPKPEAKVETPSEVSPQLAKRVHKLYEELGREDVRAVEELEQAERKIPEEEPHK
jgi:H+-transporting ATPase